MSPKKNVNGRSPKRGSLPALAGRVQVVEISLLEIQQQLLSASATSDLLTAATDMLDRLPGTIGAWIYGRDDQGGFALIQSWVSPGQELEAITASELGSLVHGRWIAAHGSGSSPREIAQPFSPMSYPNRLVVPMLLGGELIGAIVVERRDGEIYPYAPEDLAVLTMIATTVSQGLQILALRERLAQLDQPVHQDDIARRERRSLGQELHDGILQDLAYVQIKLEALERIIPTAPDVAQEQVRELYQQIDRSILNLRQTIGGLRRPAATRRGITGQLRELAFGLAEHEPALELDLAQLSGVRLAPEIERAVVGIVREALQNIRKHASASRVHVDVQRQSEDLHVVVSDNGVGIRSDVMVVPEGHFGIEQMRELAEDMGGSLQIDSSPGAGTCVRARIPLSPAP